MLPIMNRAIAPHYRHSRAGGNPSGSQQMLCRNLQTDLCSRKAFELSRWQNLRVVAWIPACAGMTFWGVLQFFGRGQFYV
jgi:hypothetical protein